MGNKLKAILKTSVMLNIEIFLLSLIGYFKDFSCIVIKVSSIVNFKFNAEKSAAVAMKYWIRLVAVVMYTFVTLIFVIAAVAVGIIIIVTYVVAVVV